MTHAELVKRAVYWLKNSQRCLIVLSEQGGGCTYEKPDAIGWHQGESILVECKVSISDLRADFQKPSRKHGDLAIGSKRYYMVPKEMEPNARAVLAEAKLDEWSAWGLLVCHENMIKAAWHPKLGRLSVLGKQYENGILMATLERIAWKISPLSICDFLRMTPSQMRAVEIREDEAPKEVFTEVH